MRLGRFGPRQLIALVRAFSKKHHILPTVSVSKHVSDSRSGQWERLFDSFDERMFDQLTHFVIQLT